MTSRQILDLCPSSGEGSEAVQAQEHLAQCPECAAVVNSRRRFDTHVGQVCRNVPIPAGLKDRLLAAAALASRKEDSARLERVPAETVRAAAGRNVDNNNLTSARPRSSVRRWTWVTSACLLLVSASLAMFWPSYSRNVPFEALVEVVAAPSLIEEQLPPFVGFAAPRAWAKPVVLQLPRSSQVASVIRSQPRLIVVRGQPCACYFFTVNGRRKAVVPGRLLVLPKSTVQNPKALTNSLATVGAWSVAAWTEGDLVYVITVAGHDELLRLEPQSVTF